MRSRGFCASVLVLASLIGVGCGSDDTSAAGGGGSSGVGGGAGAAGAAGQPGDAASDATSDADQDGAVCDLPPPNPADCTAGKSDMYCTSKSKDCPGTRYDCKNGAWVQADLDSACKMLGHDFAYGCVLDESVGGVLLVCGNNCDPADGGCD